MNKRVKISEPERLLRFVESFHENHGDDFKALALHLVASSDVESVSKQISVPVSALYDWQNDWNKKKNWDFKTIGDKVEEQNPD